MTKCKGCDQEIIWAITPAGKRTPLDAKKTRVAQLIYDDPPKIEEVHEGYVSHWATCPKAGDFKK